jgi:hypothetical protein
MHKRMILSDKNCQRKNCTLASFLPPTHTKNPRNMQRNIPIYKEKEKGLQEILMKRIVERE